MKKEFSYIIAIIIMSSVFAEADVLTVGRTRYEGSFMGFANNMFEIEPDEGKTLKKNRTMVKSLELDGTTKVTYELRGKKPVEGATLKGYEKFKFLINTGGKDIAISGSTMKNITRELSFEGTGGLGLPSGGNAPEYIKPITFTGLEDANLNPAQTAALASYKKARAAYEQNINENSALVAQMDKSSGEAREKLLNELRLRKQNEEPIKIALQKATNEVIAAFPKKD